MRRVIAALAPLLDRTMDPGEEDKSKVASAIREWHALERLLLETDGRAVAAKLGALLGRLETAWGLCAHCYEERPAADRDGWCAECLSGRERDENAVLRAALAQARSDFGEIANSTSSASNAACDGSRRIDESLKVADAVRNGTVG